MSSSAVSTPARPSTPINHPKAPSAPATPQTGTWRHPKLDEIVRRQNAATFSEKNIKMIAWNALSVAVVSAIGRSLWANLPNLFHAGKVLHPYATWIYYLLHCVFVYNIIFALFPLFRSTDNIEDIPLTPAQRKLLGLPPSSRPATPDIKYETPPKYLRTPTPLGGSPKNRGTYSDSPLSGKGDSPFSGSRSGSPFSTGPASPLLQKAMGAGSNGNRRHSYGSPSPLGPGVSRINLEAPGSPSPAAGKAPTVGLNSKWLYDKGRRQSGSARLYT
ncbi:nuclear pore complex component-domain-containing protein [Halenospora varia]|nr:nuclear pore complex component-domain-containing protein [Halenospora varia]